MKKILMCVLCLLGSATLFAQTPYKAFCTLRAYPGSKFGTVKEITIDYGQENLRGNRFVNEKGEDLEFETMTAVANYMGRAGWELVTIQTDSATLLVEWIMTKEVTSEAQITEGFLTRQLFEENRRRR